MEKITKKLLLAMLLLLPLTFASCGSDDEPENTYDDWYSEVVEVSGGGLSASQCSMLMNDLNTDEELQLGPAYVWRNMDKDQAIYYFDAQARELCADFAGGVSGLSGELVIKIALKNSAGKTVKTTSIYVTSNDAYIR